MNDLHTLLTAADPIADAPELPADEALAIRRVVLTAARAGRPPAERRSAFVPIAAVLIVVVAAGVALGWKMPERPGPAAIPDASLAAPGERRQVQFATPGGTRVIWTLDPDFELRGSTP